MKPQSKAESRHTASVCRGGNHKPYYPGSKPFMKHKLAKARRRAEKILSVP